MGSPDGEGTSGGRVTRPVTRTIAGLARTSSTRGESAGRRLACDSAAVARTVAPSASATRALPSGAAAAVAAPTVANTPHAREENPGIDEPSAAPHATATAGSTSGSESRPSVRLGAPRDTARWDAGTFGNADPLPLQSYPLPPGYELR